MVLSSRVTGYSGRNQAYKSKSIKIQDNYSNHSADSMVRIVSTPVNSVKMVIDTVVERLGTNPTDVAPTTAMDMVTPIDLLDEDTTIGTLLDVGMTLRPPLQQQLLPALRPDQRVLLTSQSTVGGLVTV